MTFKDCITMEKKTSENVCKDPRTIGKRRMNDIKTRLNDVTMFGTEYQINKLLEAYTGFLRNHRPRNKIKPCEV